MVKAKGINWIGTRTNKFNEMKDFYQQVFGLSIKHSDEGFAAYDLENGDRIELFSEDYESHKHFTTGPVAGFEVENIEEAVEELEKAGVELLGPIQGDPSKSQWQHFKGPDGNIYELSCPEK